MVTGSRGRLAGARLLLIEDTPALRELIRDMLEIEGATVSEAATGREALELVSRQPFDLALLDLGLPDMPGESVIPLIRATSQGRTPVAVLSGAGPHRLDDAVQAGAERAFGKPLDWDDLVAYLALRAVPHVG